MYSILKKSVPKDSPDETSNQNSRARSSNDIIYEFLNTKDRILTIGVGGAGSNAIDRLQKGGGLYDASTIAINTDARHLWITNSDIRILIGRELTKGKGAGNDPEIGLMAMDENIDEVIELLENTDMVFITAGLGGGTGSYGAARIAEEAKKAGALVVSIITLPFEVEGSVRAMSAMNGLQRLHVSSDSVIVVPNEKLLHLAPDLKLDDAFHIADEILVRAVKGIGELVTKPGMVNVDFADVKRVLCNSGSAVIGLGEGQGENRADKAVAMALNNPLLDVDLTQANACLVNISGSDITLDEINRCVKKIGDLIANGAEIIWGYSVESESDSLNLVTVISGVQSPYILQEADMDLGFDNAWGDL